MSAFKKLEHKKKREYVASQIMEAIRSGEFKIGDKLPSEQAMAESIGVSRPSIREALGALRIVGIIETINGVGTVVKNDKVDFLSEEGRAGLSSILGHEGNTFEVLEARKVLEPAVAVYAMDTMTEDNLSQLEGIFHRMVKAAKNKDFSEYHETNKRFHFLIASATQNSFLARSVNSLLHLFTESDFGAEMRRRYLTDSSYIVESIEVHRRILESLKKRDKSGLAKAFEDHDRQVQKQLIGQ